MDRITESMFNDFKQEHWSANMDDAEAFERFVNYSVLSSELPDSFSLDDVSCGEGNDTGMDGIAVVVNGTLVTEEEEVDELVDRNGYIEPRFVLIQSKRSSHFAAADIATFLFGAADFFSEQPRLPRTEMVQDRTNLQAHVFTKGARMTRGRPRLSLYYVTTGTWQPDANLNSRIEAGKNDLVLTNLFENVVFKPMGAADLQQAYRRAQSTLEAEFQFDNPQVLPTMPGVAEAYLGVVPAREFLRLVTDQAGNLVRSAFHDNVRDFQEYNAVNTDIQSTLQSDAKHRFAILNNGVTVIANELRRVGNTFHVGDFQIVNGCQTSHVLFDNHNLLDENVRVPLKIVRVTDENVTTQIIRATNRQTAVKPQQLYALSEFQKKLEAFFDSFDGPQKLYYERRSKQYARTPGIEKVRIVSVQQILRAYAACFLDLPHKSFYVTSLDSLVGNSIFVNDHKCDPYYISAFMAFRLEYFLRTRRLDARFKPMKYHLLMVARHLVMPSPLPRSNSREMERNCDQVASVLWDDNQVTDLFNRAAIIIGERPHTRAEAKRERLTREILARIGQGENRRPAAPQ